MKAVRISVSVVLGLVLLGVAGIGFGAGWPVILGPDTRTVTDRRFEATPARLARGEYLVEGVAACMKCHSSLDLDRFGAPPKEGMHGAGALHRGPGVIAAPNLTPDRETGLGAWSDDEIARAIREGVSRDGRALFPMMPYHKYRVMSDEDIASMVVYLRSLEPVRNALPETEIIFPVKYLIRTYPKAVRKPLGDPPADEAERGKYLVALAACEDCHTTFDAQRNPIPGLEFAGGNTMEENEGVSVIPNITPDATGIGNYTPETFREVLRTGREGSRELHPLMPYHFYQRLTDEDLDAMFAYLRTVKPVKHWVNVKADPVLCALCGMKHGMGEMN